MGSMASENELKDHIGAGNSGGRSKVYLQKFKLYETFSNFYMIGRDKHRTCWNVLKISRLEQSELKITEDSTVYSEIECHDLLTRIHEGNKSTGGLKFVTACYGIVGFIKFLGPHYMLLITKRRKIGTICGHAVYSVAKSEMIPVPNPTMHSNMAYSKIDNRYKKLLRIVDLTKEFFFSYSYHVMLSLQKNLSSHETGLELYENMFVWNEFLTRGIHSQLKNSVWTVALVHGFFRQVKLSVSGRDFNLIVIARRSRHFAGTRYLKRGVNEQGRVANDVETEQIVIEDFAEGKPIQISSAVQNRGSIPLFWSQETSRSNFKPDIILSKKDHEYQTTKLHFENLVRRYGNPIIILNLIKTREKKPRESLLRAEFANAIEAINKDLPHENLLKFLHWDLSKYSRNKAVNVLAYLVKFAANALELTGFFYGQVFPSSSNNCDRNHADEDLYSSQKNHHDTPLKDGLNEFDVDGSHFLKPPMFQKGVLRTNCIDCLDRTNVAQYVYGFVALGHQLHALGYLDVSSISLDSPLADDLMKMYEAMGDTLALQYGGSAAHNKIFSESRGQWKAATQSQELFITLQRYYNNTYMDAKKQDAIDVFLGHFQPQQGKPALWELHSDQQYSVGAKENARQTIKKSLSDGNIHDSTIDEANAIKIDSSPDPLPVKTEGYNLILSKPTSEILTCESGLSFSRYTPSTSRRHLVLDTENYRDNDQTQVVERSDSFSCSNFFDIDWLSSSGNSCEEEKYERSSLINSSSGGAPSSEVKLEASSSGSSSKGKEVAREDLIAISSADLCGYSEKFVNWVANGHMFFP